MNNLALLPNVVFRNSRSSNSDSWLGKAQLITSLYPTNSPMSRFGKLFHGWIYCSPFVAVTICSHCPIAESVKK